MNAHNFSNQEYIDKFRSTSSRAADPINTKALEHALDIRKFEIDLYWKRAAYFWAFIAATLAGFVAIQASDSENKEMLSVLLANLGIAFSMAWLSANRGSKHWQENWEKHVDMLEDDIHGPLYKVVLTRRPPKGLREFVVHLLTGPSPISVSKVNQLISFYVTTMWIALLIYALPPIEPSRPINWLYSILTTTTILLCAAFLTIGRSYQGNYWHQGSIRTSCIRNESTREN